MKKLLVIHNKYKIFGGEDSNIDDEIEHLNKDYEIKYLEYDNSEKIKLLDLVGFVTRSNINSNKKLVYELDTFKPDVVYIHNTWFKANLGIFKILKARNITTLYKIHNFRYDCGRFFLASKHLRGKSNCDACYFQKKSKIFNKYYEDSYLKSLFLIFYSKKLFRIIKYYPIKILVLTNFHREYLGSMGIDLSKVYIYCNPIKLNNLKSEKTNQPNYLIYAGRLTKEKGIENLLDTWLSANLTKLKLKIIGSGNLEYKLKKKYNEENIDFVGNLSNEDVLLEIKNSIGVITATKMYEGQPRLLCEASSYGVPSIYPSFGGMDEFFPSNYQLSFEQFNYQDLKTKIYEIENLNKSNNFGASVHDYIASKLNPEKLLKQFKNIIDDE